MLTIFQCQIFMNLSLRKTASNHCGKSEWNTGTGTSVFWLLSIPYQQPLYTPRQYDEMQPLACDRMF